MPDRAWKIDGEASDWTLTDTLQKRVSLGLGPAALAARHWPDGRPRSLAVENAIDDVEMAIERSPLRHADRDLLTLVCADPAVLSPWLPADAELHRDEVERAFSMWAATLDRPGAVEPSVSGDGAAALLMLRELMHHLGFQRCYVVRAPTRQTG